MKKSKAIELFGGEVKDLAEALDWSAQYVSTWPEDLPNRRIREILGQAILQFGVERVRKAFPEIQIDFKTPM